MPFGIPSEDFHGGFGLPHDDDDYDPYTGKYAFCSPSNEGLGFGEGWINESPEMPDEDRELAEAAQEAHDNLVRSLVEAGGEIREAKALLVRALDQLYLLGYDSGFTNPAIEQLVTDIKFYLKRGKI